MSKQSSPLKLFHLVSTLHQALFRVSDQGLAARAGVSTTQSAVLMYLRGNANASMSDVASAVGIKLTSASGLVDRMTAKGLLMRTRSESDARTVVLTLTGKGRHLADETLPWVKQMNEAMLAACGTSEEIETFKAVCERLIAASNDVNQTAALVVAGNDDGPALSSKKMKMQ